MSTIVLKTLQRFQASPKLFTSQIRQIKISNCLRNDNPSKIPKVKKRTYTSPISWMSVALGGTLGAGIMGYMYYLKKKKQLSVDREMRRSIGKSQIGGRFDLVNSKGERVKSEDFLGQWVLLYFGFTHCPDICPDEVQKMVDTVEYLEKRSLKVQPIFISVDPDRDTPEVVGKYCKEFSDKIIGLTGSREEVGAACKAYRVYFSSGPKDSDADYIVDHTIIMYLLDPEGTFVDYYGQTSNADQIVTSVLLHEARTNEAKGEIPWPSLWGRFFSNPA